MWLYSGLLSLVSLNLELLARLNFFVWDEKALSLFSLRWPIVWGSELPMVKELGWLRQTGVRVLRVREEEKEEIQPFLPFIKNNFPHAAEITLTPRITVILQLN